MNSIPSFIDAAPGCEIVTVRTLNTSRELVFKAWTEPEHLKKWWGPKGFTNTFNEFNLQEGGKWSFVMHGPVAGNYRNECVFINILKPEFLAWDRLSDPKFQVQVTFKELSPGKTEIIFKMVFTTKEGCDKLKPFVPEKNEENFDRLEAELQNMY